MRTYGKYPKHLTEGRLSSIQLIGLLIMLAGLLILNYGV